VRFALAASFLVLAAPAGAAAQVFQPGTQPIGDVGGITVPIQSSRTCRTCHGNYDMADDYEPYESWRGSLMASAMRDPIARAAIAIAEVDLPSASDFCVRCHSPTGWLNARSELPEYAATNPDRPERLAYDRSTSEVMAPGLSAELDGIGCMVCHRMTEPPMPSMISNAQLVVADGVDADTRRGPYAYGPGEDPRHPTAMDPFVSSSELCGSCHDIHNPTRDGFRGTTPTGRPFAIERTYSEWLNSAFADRGETCQSCHMPELSGLAAGEGIVRPMMNRHELVGGNVWVPLAIAEMVRPFDMPAATMMEATSVRAAAMLRRAATLEIRTSALAGTSATATVRVTNLTGHKLPTGYPEGRRMWLEVAVLDESGRVVAGSGIYDATTATLLDDPQLRTYEAKLGVGGVEGFHFALNDTLIEDTRIPPEGFRAPAAADIEPLGRDYSDGAGGFRDYDEASYTLDGLCGTGMLTLRARLRYQTTTREYVEFLRDTAPDSPDPMLAGRSWGDVAYDAWRMHGGDVPSEMAEASVVLGAAPMACPEPDGGPPDAGAEDAGGGVDAGPPVATPSCGCRAGGSSSSAWIALLPIAVLVMRRRRRAR
jgi:MYXO-CTERM domain-containing protein